MLICACSQLAKAYWKRKKTNPARKGSSQLMAKDACKTNSPMVNKPTNLHYTSFQNSPCWLPSECCLTRAFRRTCVSHLSRPTQESLSNWQMYRSAAYADDYGILLVPDKVVCRDLTVTLNTRSDMIQCNTWYNTLQCRWLQINSDLNRIDFEVNIVCTSKVYPDDRVLLKTDKDSQDVWATFDKCVYKLVYWWTTFGHAAGGTYPSLQNINGSN